MLNSQLKSIRGDSSSVDAHKVEGNFPPLHILFKLENGSLGEINIIGKDWTQSIQVLSSCLTYSIMAPNFL